MSRGLLLAAGFVLPLSAALAACSSPSPAASTPAPPEPPTPAPPKTAAPAPPETAAPQPAISSTAPLPVRDLESTRQLAAAVVKTVAAVETGKELRFGVIATGQTVGHLRRLGAVELHRMEWHGNPVGDRWRQADVTTCATCEGFTPVSVNLLDGKVFLAEIRVDPQPRPATTRADVLCEAIRTQLTTADGRVSATKCTCSEPGPKDEISKWSLPRLDGLSKPSCDPAVQSVFHFALEIPKAVDDIPRATGTVSVSQSNVQVALNLYGQRYGRLLAAKRALNSRTFPVP